MIPRLWLCADLSHDARGSLVARVERALQAGPALVWLRGWEQVGARVALSTARRLRDLTLGRGHALFIGDRLDIARCVSADGVHLPTRAFDPADLAPKTLLVSVACHHASTAARARREVDALVASPYGAVPGKALPLGRDGLRAIIDAARGTPTIALGGVDAPETAGACLDAGAWGVAIRRGLLDAVDPLPVCEALQRALGG